MLKTFEPYGLERQFSTLLANIENTVKIVGSIPEPLALTKPLLASSDGYSKKCKESALFPGTSSPFAH